MLRYVVLPPVEHMHGHQSCAYDTFIHNKSEAARITAKRQNAQAHRQNIHTRLSVTRQPA